MLDAALKVGVKSAVGIEPVARNVESAKKLYPNILTIQASLEDFSTDQRFGVVTSLMSLVHIEDLDVAFGKINELLERGGEFQTIVPDFDHQRRPRHGYQIAVEEIDHDEYVIAVERPSGILVDLVRRTSKYEDCARKHGARLIEDIPMVPTENLMAALPRFRESAGIPLTHLLRFCK